MKTIIATIAATAAVITLSTSTGHAAPATTTKTTVVIENGECYTLFDRRFSCERQHRYRYRVDIQQINPFGPGQGDRPGIGRGDRGGDGGHGGAAGGIR